MSANTADLSEEDKNTFNQAFSMQLLTIVEGVESLQSQKATQTLVSSGGGTPSGGLS